VLSATVQGIQRYLGSGMIKGIGPVMAERMVQHFGVDIMHIIDDSPGRLIEVDGLGPKRIAKITAAWAEQKASKEVMVFLISIKSLRPDTVWETKHLRKSGARKGIALCSERC
jgi:exodeoxyribonuclease V alpha subunit